VSCGAFAVTGNGILLQGVCSLVRPNFELLAGQRENGFHWQIPVRACQQPIAELNNRRNTHVEALFSLVLPCPLRTGVDGFGGGRLAPSRDKGVERGAGEYFTVAGSSRLMTDTTCLTHSLQQHRKVSRSIEQQQQQARAALNCLLGWSPGLRCVVGSLNPFLNRTGFL
jgi:hypothetical protein